MSARRLMAIAVIYVLAVGAWATLGTSIVVRTGECDSKLTEEVSKLWGGRHRQVAPRVWVERPRQVTEQVPTQAEGTRITVTKEVTRTVTDVAPLRLSQSRIQADLQLTNRQKGLLWYDTYGVRFSGHFTARNPDPIERVIGVELKFPSSDGIYDQFVFRVNGESAPPANDLTKGLVTRVRVPPGSVVSIDVGYVSRGMDDWEYAFAENGVGGVSDLE